MELGTVRQALRWGRQVLQPSETASLDAQLLLAHLLGRGRAWLYAHPEERLSLPQRSAYQRLIALRRAGEPVAYLRGRVEWFGLDLEVTPDVLVPRPETELMLEKALEIQARHGAKIVADVGTGSGAIAIAIALAAPAARVYGVDVSEPALRIAARNAQRHAVSDRVTWLQGGLLEPLPARPDLIVANLPYLSDEMMESLDRDVRQEPRLALHGGASGLELYETLFEQMSDRGWLIPSVLEIDPRQADGIRALTARYFPGAMVDIFRDYAGRDRIVVHEP